MDLRRTTIFIPGTMDEAGVRDRIRTCGADLICLDLEDTVHPSRKGEARQLIVRLLQEDIWGRAARAVRINAISSPFARDDVEVVVGAAGDWIDTLLLSKPESADEIRTLDGWIANLRSREGFTNRIGYLVGIESAYALTHIDEIASASPNVEALGLAVGDLSVSLHVNIGAFLQDRSRYPGDLFHFHRARLILAARTHGLWAMDAPWPIINDHATLAEDARWGMMMGFDGKLVLAPEQVRTVHEAYRPSEGEVAYARDVLAKMEAFDRAGEGSGMSGKMFLDPVVIEPARRTLARYEASL